MAASDCIFCGSPYQQHVLSLGIQPLANEYLRADQLDVHEPTYPLDLYLCEDCLLTHIAETVDPESLIRRSVNFSSYSSTCLQQAESYCDAVMKRFGIDRTCFVLEIASNDGYLLRNFVQRNIRCVGVEAAANVAADALALGVDTRVGIWGCEMADEFVEEGCLADLVIANNVLAHTPRTNDFLEAVTRVLKPDGVLTLEFTHLYQLVKHHEFDMIHHEHFAYFALFVIKKILMRHHLVLFDAEELPTHGRSLRVYACHTSDVSKPIGPRVGEIIAMEEAAGMMRLDYYHDFAKAVKKSKADIRRFFQRAQSEGKRVAGYGAPSKGNILLNYCGIGLDCIPYTVDRSPHKQGRFLPGSRIPVRAPAALLEDKPDYVFILPWNLKDEIMEQMSAVRGWGGQFVVPIPHVEILA
jgi:SAM-dependent methyltransferase